MRRFFFWMSLFSVIVVVMSACGVDDTMLSLDKKGKTVVESGLANYRL